MRTSVAALAGCCLVTCLLKAALEANLHTGKADASTGAARTYPDGVLESTSTCCTCEVLPKSYQKKSEMRLA